MKPMYIPPQTIITIDQKPTWTVKSITSGRNKPKREERSCKKRESTLLYSPAKAPSYSYSRSFTRSHARL